MVKDYLSVREETNSNRDEDKLGETKDEVKEGSEEG